MHMLRTMKWANTNLSAAVCLDSRDLTETSALANEDRDAAAARAPSPRRRRLAIDNIVNEWPLA